MRKPAIFVFTTSYHPFIGGAEIAITETARRLKDRFDFFIVTSRFRRDLPAREEWPEGTVIRIGFGTRFDKWLLPFFGVARVIWNLEFGIWNFTARGRAVLWGMDIGQGSLAAALVKALRPRTPFVLSIQYGESEERLRRARMGGIGLGFRFMLQQADFLAPESTYLLDLARRFGYKGPAEVIPNGVDINKFNPPTGGLKPKTQNLKPTVITASRLVHKNGIDVLIDAMAEVKKEIPDAECWILGDGPERNNSESRIKNQGLEDTIKLFGSVGHDRVPEYFYESAIFVRPSRSEGMGNAFVEALASGLPIIGTPVGGIPDIIKDGETGLFAKPEDSNDLADKIIRLLKDSSLRARIAKEGGKMVRERFTWDGIASAYARGFEKAGAGLRIAIATPLYPPALGGPAQYAANLAREFGARGHRAEVLSYGRDIPLSIPAGFRHLVFFFRFFTIARRADIIFSLDQFSAGFPASIAALLLRRPYMTRVEGDFLWEGFVERTRTDITLADFYRHPPHLSLKESFIKRGIGFVLRRADMLVFSSEWRREMIRRAYGIPAEKTAIIKNVWPSLENQESRIKNQGKIVLWAGRMIYLKNLHRLIDAFSRANDGSWELYLVGEGPEREALESRVRSLKFKDKIKFFDPMPREELFEKYREAALFVLPSLSEVGPNSIADAIATGTPFIMTKESGYAELMRDYGLLVDPLDENDLEQKLRFMMDEKTRENYQKKLEGWKNERSWPQAAEEWIGLCKRILGL